MIPVRIPSLAMILIASALALPTHADPIADAFAARFDAGDSSHEYSAGMIREAVSAKSDDTEFYYVNPRMRPDACAAPLSLDEKIAQQKGDAYRETLQGAHQLSRFRDGWLNRLAESTSWIHERWLGDYDVFMKNRRNHAVGLFSNKDLTLAFDDMLKIRERTWDLQDKYFGKGDGVGEDDEADAFRHFVGAGLLYARLGDENTRIILNIHEQDDVSLGSLMDRYNNELALEEARSLAQQGKLNEAGLTVRAFELIQKKTLVFLRTSVKGAAAPAPHPKFRAWAHEALNKTLD